MADFGVARFESQHGDMTAETGTYRWMAPEVFNFCSLKIHLSYFWYVYVCLWLCANYNQYFSKLPTAPYISCLQRAPIFFFFKLFGGLAADDSYTYVKSSKRCLNTFGLFILSQLDLLIKSPC